MKVDGPYQKRGPGQSTILEPEIVVTRVVDRPGFEPGTFGLQIRRAYQIRYHFVYTYDTNLPGCATGPDLMAKRQGSSKDKTLLI